MGSVIWVNLLFLFLLVLCGFIYLLSLKWVCVFWVVGGFGVICFGKWMCWVSLIEFFVCGLLLDLGLILMVVLFFVLV